MQLTPHWRASGLYPVSAVGVSFYREAVAELTGNGRGTDAFSLCCARLVPYDSNEFDPNAVRIEIDGKTIGHLNRDLAIAFRCRLIDLFADSIVTTCDAAISNGLVTDERTYSYTVELDIDLSLGASTNNSPRYQSLTRREANSALSRRPDGSYVAVVRLGSETIGNLHKQLRTGSWTTDDWTTVNYYIDNKQGIGLGHRILSVPKDENFAMFGEVEPDVVVESIEGRYATVVLKPMQDESAAITEAPNPSVFAQAECQRQATKPGLVVRGTFSPAGAWRPAVVARSNVSAS